MIDDEPSVARGPYAKTAERRSAIARAALESFGEHGYERASLRDIAARTGITHAGLLRHFGSKTELLVASLEQFDREAADVGAAAIAAGESPEAVIMAVLADDMRHPDRLRAWLSLSLASTRSDHPAHDYFLRRSRSAVDAFTGAADRDGLGSRSRALLYLAVIDGLRLRWLADPSVDILAAMRQFIRAMLFPDGTLSPPSATDRSG